MPGYLGNDPAGSATKIARQTYTTSGAATTDFTFTSGYDVGYLDVYVNGERQTKGKNFTASDGSTFRVLNGGVGTGSTVEAIAYKTFNLATVDFDDLGNTGNLTLSGDISAVNGTFSGDVSIGGTLTYEDVTSIDSVGVITARLGVDIITGGIDIVGNTTGLNVTGVGTFVDVNVSGAATIAGATDLNGALDVNGEVTVSPNTAGKNTITLTTNASNDGRVLVKSDTTTKVDIQANGTSFFDGGSVEFRSADAVGIADSIFHIGDTNTKIRFPAADTFTVETGGSERFKVTDSLKEVKNGNLRITSSFIEFSGDVTTPSAAAALYRPADNEFAISTGNNERLRIDSSGNVGIGTTIADRALHVLSTNGTVAHFESNNANEIAQVVFEGLGASAPPNLGATGEDLHFTTNNLERVRITSAGDVGIGTTIPRNVSNFGSFAINGTSGAFADYVLNGTRTGTVAVDSNGFTCEAVGSSTPFRVITNGSERVRVDIGGNVNITGITTASQLFEGTNRVATAGKAVAMALVFG